jgi:hypothetical protein
MKLSPCSGGKPQSVENGIGGGSLRFSADPFLNPRQPLGGLMNVVAVDKVGKGLEQLLKTLLAAGDRLRRRDRGSASWHTRYGSRFFDVLHSTTFPPGVPTPLAKSGDCGRNQRCAVE